MPLFENGYASSHGNGGGSDSQRIRRVAYAEQPALERANQSWAMDFMQDGLADGDAADPEDPWSLHTGSACA